METVVRTFPHSLQMIRTFWPEIHKPVAVFDPCSNWQHTYRCLMPVTLNPKETWNSGSLQITRSGVKEGARLHVISTRVNNRNRFAVAAADIECAADGCSSLRSWQKSAVILDAEHKAVPYTRTSSTGAPASSKIRMNTGGRTMLIGKHSCNWTLFDAVQRLEFGAKPVRFDLLEELEKSRPDHHIEYAGTQDVQLGGRDIRLYGFVQIGSGIWDGAYWLDEQHRLLIASVGLMTYIYDPDAEIIKERS